ncbi:MAG: glycosyltransferase family 4 protein [Scytolyngbya sp. HA4215-MV1]|jgi:glycosyltransferase involved in cell wall biosynthesis|nr:glycosyltransferase family 4 protein [Scytolyngbya sp. HA4215-MV1]
MAEKELLQQLHVLKSIDLQQRDDIAQDLQQSIRLLIVTQFYPPDYAATGQLIEELAVQLGKMGVRVRVFAGQPGYAFNRDSAPGFERSGRLQVVRSRASQIWPHRIRGRAINGFLFCIRAGLHLLKRARENDVLLLTTEPPYLTILGYLAHLFFRIPYVCLLYDLYPDVVVELNVLKKHHWLVRFWDWLNGRIWRNAQAIVVLSSTMKDRIVTKCPGIASKTIVIHSWANPDIIKPIDKTSNWFAQQFDLEDKFTVLYSGNMGRCHDIDTILAAAEALQDEPIQFLFIGGGAKRRISAEKALSLGLSNCRFLPYQKKGDLPYSLTAGDLSLVSISPGMEGLVAPSKLYGILATGRPVAVICEPHSYLRQLICEAKCGEAFDNGDDRGLAQFIYRLAHNALLAKALGNAGRRYLQSHFTPEITASQYLKVLVNSVRTRSDR